MAQFLDKTSLFIGHVAKILTLLSFYLITALIAAATLFALISVPFEHSVSQDDLALADIVSLALIGLASWRFFQRGSQSGLSGWALVKRFSFALTYTTLLCVAVFALFLSVAYFYPETVKSDLVVLTGGYDDLLTYGLAGIFISVIYGATSLPSLFSREASGRHDSKSSNQHPVHSPEPPILKPDTEKEPK